jgi:hypothetical protein
MFKALRELFSSGQGKTDAGDGEVTLADVLERGWSIAV